MDYQELMKKYKSQVGKTWLCGFICFALGVFGTLFWFANF
jgi:hypothetical protein